MEGEHVVSFRVIAKLIRGHLQDEAYELGRQWANFYEPDSPSRKLIKFLAINGQCVEELKLAVCFIQAP